MSVMLGIRDKHMMTYGFSDWVLPSKDELNAMYVNLHLFSLGDFFSELVDIGYWSSTEADSSDSWKQYFYDGAQSSGPDAQKSFTGRVRPCRAFIGEVGDYALRDVGPAGGLIFLIVTGVKYYEAAPSDISNSYIWSNIGSTTIGTTSADIGEGYDNTLEIIAQAGHTTSAAKLCNDLVL